jgi:hypothetical protein
VTRALSHARIRRALMKLAIRASLSDQSHDQ